MVSGSSLRVCALVTGSAALPMARDSIDLLELAEAIGRSGIRRDADTHTPFLALRQAYEQALPRRVT